MTVKHQKSCGTCAWAKTRQDIRQKHKEIHVPTSEYRWYKSCTNPNGLEYKTTIEMFDDISYVRGKSCHTKKGEQLASNNSDYVEYQKGNVKLL